MWALSPPPSPCQAHCTRCRAVWVAWVWVLQRVVVVVRHLTQPLTLVGWMGRVVVWWWWGLTARRGGRHRSKACKACRGCMACLVCMVCLVCLVCTVCVTRKACSKGCRG